MSDSWKDFFSNYRRLEATTDSDLFFQIGKTVNQKPISEDVFKLQLDRIKTRLHLREDDHLFDYCCGNGLVTFELSSAVRRVDAVDFAEHLIATACKMRFRHNINYHVGDALAPLSVVLGKDEFPTKFLMNAALAYFEPEDLGKILANIKVHQKNYPFLFLLTDIPNFDSRWNFYNTPERRARHLENEKNPTNTNDGLGRWWSANEIEQLCQQYGLAASMESQPPELSNYRMDALISPVRGN